jgi:hypothetical protein
MIHVMANGTWQMAKVRHQADSLSEARSSRRQAAKAQVAGVGPRDTLKK